MLDQILASTRQRLPDLTAQEDQIVQQAMATAPPPSFIQALATSGMEVIAEVKRRSPSRGDLAPDLDPVAQAAHYTAGGAAAISVLTEPEFFAGSNADLTAVALATGAPVLRKDFVVHPAQVWQARSLGAAALLLIVAALDDAELANLIGVAADAGVEPLVEVHTAEEAERAMAAGSRIVGVNNRDLNDFSVDLGTAEKIAPIISDATVTIAESGIFTGEDSRRMAEAGYDAVLVGEALVRADDPAALVRELRG